MTASILHHLATSKTWMTWALDIFNNWWPIIGCWWTDSALICSPRTRYENHSICIFINLYKYKFHLRNCVSFTYVFFFPQWISLATCLLWTCFAEYIPKAKSLISSTSYYCLPIRWHGQIEHSIWMASEVCNLCKARILPHKYLVLRVPMGADLQEIKCTKKLTY